jgi:high-affinity iron transporter
MASLAAKEYAEGVAGGVVVSIAEVEEAVLFLGEAHRATSGLPATVIPATTAFIDSALVIVHGTGSAGQVAMLAEALVEHLRVALGGVEEPIPSLRPPPAQGRRLFARNCTECHGNTGAGDGFRATELDPPPADLTDTEMMADQSPLDHFRKIRFGVSGTDMQAYEGDLGDDEIWALAWYVARLRAENSTRARGQTIFRALCPECWSADSPGTAGLIAAPAALADPVIAARTTDEDLHAMVRQLAAQSSRPADSVDAAAVVHFLRTLPFAEQDAAGAAGTFATVRTELARALRQARRGETESASDLVFDAYTAFEQVEGEIVVRDRQLATALEGGFGDFRGRLARGDDADDLAQTHEFLLRDLRSAQVLLQGSSSALGLFFQSFVLLLREGLEAILIVGALATVVVRAGIPERRRDLWWGVGAAVLASAVTAVLLESVFRLGVAEQEALEGFTMLAATAVLIFVSYWLLAKVEVNHWKSFVTAKVREAVTSGSMITLAAAAFLAVYREGFETILFYKALFITAVSWGCTSASRMPGFAFPCVPSLA